MRPPAGVRSYVADVQSVILEVTDETVRACGGTSRRPARALIDAALDWIDEPVGLYDDKPVVVADLWRSVVMTLLGPRRDAVSVVYPPDWTRGRVDRVIAAVNTVADHIDAVSADQWDPSGSAVRPDPAETRAEAPSGRRRGLGWVSLLVAVAVLLVGGAVVRAWPRPDDGATVAEGRMAVRIPTQWSVQRVTNGPGSRRLQARSPTDPRIAVHLTWSYAPATTLAEAADVLRRAIGAEPPGVFDGLKAEANVAGRAAVTYRENRPGRVIAWIVVIDGATRIGIGCESPPGREPDVRAVCDATVRSAHERPRAVRT